MSDIVNDAIELKVRKELGSRIRKDIGNIEQECKEVDTDGGFNSTIIDLRTFHKMVMGYIKGL